ncbi:MAG: hypothetical protein NT108_01760 [Candidatus Kaiserbacteria bacterium]|nr:hypothetical protein [Candidatus Kaiserbacteria bacterium]
MDRTFGLIVLVTAFLTTGCASQGERKLISITMPDREEATIVAHNQIFPNWTIDQDTYKLNYIIAGKAPSNKQFAAVEEAERVCREYTKVVHPNDLMTVGVDAIMFGAAGAAGGAVGSLAFSFAKASEYAMYAGASGGFFGGAYGALTLGGKVYTFESCGREVMARFSAYRVQVLMRTPY